MTDKPTMLGRLPKGIIITKTAHGHRLTAPKEDTHA